MYVLNNIIAVVYIFLAVAFDADDGKIESSVPDLWHFGTDLDADLALDPALFVGDLQDAPPKNFY